MKTIYSKSKISNKFINSLIFLLGMFLHQSMLTPIGNLSIAEFILLGIIIYSIINKKITLDVWLLVSVIFFFVFIFFTSVFYSPIHFSITISGSSFISEIIKLLVLLSYFLIGTIISKNKINNKLLKVYSYTAVVIAIIGIFFSVFTVSFINEIIFNYGTRLNGFMNDPNYFAIIQITALPYFFKNSNLENRKNYFFIIIIMLSIILSGSKTGLLSLSAYILFIIFENVIYQRERATLNSLIQRIFIIGILFLGLIILTNNFSSIIYWLNTNFPSSIRITSLFSDFESAISSGGSSRDIAWKNGIEIVKASPIFGVGVSNYSNIASKYLGTGVLAHNTYIQLAAEWGLPITILFFSGIIILLIIIILTRKNHNINLSIQKDILIIFLVGSMGVSLNNARFFWLILGSIITLVKYEQVEL